MDPWCGGAPATCTALGPRASRPPAGSGSGPGPAARAGPPPPAPPGPAGGGPAPPALCPGGAGVPAPAKRGDRRVRAGWRHPRGKSDPWGVGPPFHLKTGDLDKASGGILKYISQHQSLVEGTVVTGGRIAVEVLAGVVLTFFVTFFLIKDGRKIWVWLIHRAKPQNKSRIDRAGRSAWQAVVYYVRGTVVVAAIHAIVMGITLTVRSAPLAVALALV